MNAAMKRRRTREWSGRTTSEFLGMSTVDGVENGHHAVLHSYDALRFDVNHSCDGITIFYIRLGEVELGSLGFTCRETANQGETRWRIVI